MSVALKIFGEAHTHPESIKDIRDALMKLKPTVIVHELLDDAVLSPEQVVVELENCGKPHSLCFAETNVDVFRLARELGAGLVGCDLSDDLKRNLKSRSLRDQFVAREAQMLRVIKSIKDPGNTVVVVGDIHLRYGKTQELGNASPIVLASQRGEINVDIYRCSKGYRETY